jgi:hypothetical protein
LRLDGIGAHIRRCAQHRADCVALGPRHARGEIRRRVSLHFGARLVDRSHGFLEHHSFGVRVPALSLTKRSHLKLDDRQPLEQFAVGLPGVLCPKSREQFAVVLDLNGRRYTRPR